MVSPEYFSSSKAETIEKLKDELLMLQKLVESTANDRDAFKIKLMVQREITCLEEKKKKQFEEENKILHVQIESLNQQNANLSRKLQEFESQVPQNLPVIIGSPKSCNSKADSSRKLCSDSSSCSSLNSEEKAIRLHAQKMLLWANQTVDKKGYVSSNSSIASFESNMTSKSNIHNRLPRFPSKQKITSTPPRPPLSSSSKDSRRNFKSLFTSNKSPSRVADLPISSEKSVSSLNLNNDNDNDNKSTLTEACHSSTKKIFPKNVGEAEFFLPKIDNREKENNGMDLKCSTDGSILLDGILRPWQTDFLKCLAITSSKELIKETNERAQAIARTMKLWCKKKQKKSVRTKSCLVALYIWSRTAEQTNKKIVQQRIIGIEQVRKPNLLDLTFSVEGHSSDGSISTIGCNSIANKSEINLGVKYAI